PSPAMLTLVGSHLFALNYHLSLDSYSHDGIRPALQPFVLNRWAGGFIAKRVAFLTIGAGK
ncbi:hypothetical protein, partial [Pseudomonas syringae]|uniref:hypothetical protein n=1 Tax=Pseudomonas syringae TaxID=317 RepID=UPI001F432C7E